jgi:hypothetical protein
MSTPSSGLVHHKSPYSTGTRKKRLACDACHASKVRRVIDLKALFDLLTFQQVRCTGETTGCQRCRRSDRFCHYSESNMGRTMDGTHKRRKASAWATSIAGHGEIHEFDWTSSRSASTSTNQTDLISVTRGPSELDHLASETPFPLYGDSRTLHQHDLDAFDANQEPDSGSGSIIQDLDDIDFDDIQSTLLEDDALLDMNFPQLLPSPPPQLQIPQQLHNHPTSETSASTTSLSGVPDKAEPAPSLIQTWSSLLEQLSRTSSPSHVPLDTLLHTTSTLLPQATHTLTSLSADQCCLTPLILIILCLSQVVSLFEQCRVETSGGPSSLSLRLGDFQIDREVQAALQRHVVAKELVRMLHVVQTIRQLLKNPTLAGAEKKAHGVVADDLVRRIRALGALLAEKGGN